MVQIIPAVLATTKEQYSLDLQKLEKSEALRNGWVHIDFIDGVFLQNKTIGAKEAGKHPTTLQKEAHIMVEHPRTWIEALAEASFKRVLFHVEASDNIEKCIDEIKKAGMEVGLVLKHETPLEKLDPFTSKIDAVLLMSVVPGFQGQPFIEGSLNKVKQLKLKYPQVRVGVDGAVKDANIKQIVEARVDYVCVGSFLVKSDPDESMEKLWEAING